MPFLGEDVGQGQPKFFWPWIGVVRDFTAVFLGTYLVANYPLSRKWVIVITPVINTWDFCRVNPLKKLGL